MGSEQTDALGCDELAKTLVDAVPVDEIDPVGQVAVAERLGEARRFVERQRSAGVDREVEIGITARPAGRARSEYPHLGAIGQLGA